MSDGKQKRDTTAEAVVSSGGWPSRIVNHRARSVAIPLTNVPYGSCRWCGKEILRENGTVNRRRNWHPECVETYKLTWPQAWRRAVKERDGGICALCPPGTDPYDTPENPGPWHADHIVPLIDGGDWSLDNAQTLCGPHHLEKTANENRERAARRRASTTSDRNAVASKKEAR